ncbi:unnamed protein product [Sphagnum troendelagicum]|uniref:Uncharacterized protein n=1 Tax=Sphagnum jensenii TaxID=128206 RepID=A0ABP0X115_9BRYO
MAHFPSSQSSSSSLTFCCCGFPLITRMDRKLGFQSSTFRGILLHLLLLSAARRSLPNSGFPRPLFLSLPQLPQIGDRSGELGPASSPSCAV